MSKLYNTVLIMCIAVIATFSTEVSHTVSEYQFGSSYKTVGGSANATELPSYDAMMIVGDVMLARKVDFYMRTEGVFYPFSRLPVISSSTLLLGNFESSVPEVHVPTPFFNFAFSTPVSYIEALKKYGFTHLSLANNHSFDFGSSGYKHTLTSMYNAGITPFGHPATIDSSSISFVNINGMTIALVSINRIYASSPYDALDDLLQSARQSSDSIIVYVHWGNEYAPSHNQEQAQLATYLSERGVDIVIGHHPHVVQDVQIVNNTLVFYSLGNFIFDQYFSQSVQEGLTLRLTLEAGAYHIELVPVTSIDKQSAPRLMNAEELTIFFSKLALKSDEALQSSIENGVLSWSL